MKIKVELDLIVLLYLKLFENEMNNLGAQLIYNRALFFCLIILFIAEQEELTKDSPIQKLLDRVFKDNEDGKRTLLAYLETQKLFPKTSIKKVGKALAGFTSKDICRSGKVVAGDAGEFLESLGI